VSPLVLEVAAIHATIAGTPVTVETGDDGFLRIRLAER
jgi:hypothetical protein